MKTKYQTTNGNRVESQKLSDGSTVYAVVISDGEDSCRIECDTLKGANELQATLTRVMVGLYANQG